MVEITDETKCCGCTSCVNACPKGAIDMVPDKEGFLYPKTDVGVCIDCGICNKVCPIEHSLLNANGKLESYVVRTKETDVLAGSTSGGFITPLAIYVLEHQGILCAATYDMDFRVKHSIICRSDELSSVRGSKYVQSDLGTCFRKIKRYLDEDRLVCFVGTACQVYGLKAYLRKDYKKLISVDLVCHGVPSPKLWDRYLDYQKNKYHSDIREVSFRNKTYGYHSSTMKICFANGKVYQGSARVDYMLKSFFTEIASRPACYQCQFKTLERCSDFTIYDCWHAAELVPGLADDDRGYTNVIVQSERGRQMLEKIKDFYHIYKVNTEQAVKLDGIMVMESAVPHPGRQNFYVKMDKCSMRDLIHEFIPVSKRNLLLERAKIVFYRLGIYHFAKRLLKR